MTDEQIDSFLIENYKTMKNTELIKACNIKQYQLYRSINRLGINKKPQKFWTDDEINLLKKMWDMDSKSDILKSFPNRSYTGIMVAAHKIGLHKDKSILSHNKLAILLEEKNEIYYWLGFLMADGHFSKLNDIKLAVSAKDLNHLEKFGKLINANISSCKKIKYNGYTSKKNS